MPPARRNTASSKSAPLEAMEARSVDAIPRGSEWQYEPKWDGFRCLLSRDGDKVELRSKSGEDLTRYFPELVDAARKLKAADFMLDGEIVVPHGKALSFDDLLQRIHPAASRVRKLAQETPELYIAFDLLANAKTRSCPPSRSAKGARRWKPLQRSSSNPIQRSGCRLRRKAKRPPKNGWRNPAAAATA
jgi:ATP-dependent DNA ligase